MGKEYEYFLHLSMTNGVEKNDGFRCFFWNFYLCVECPTKKAMQEKKTWPKSKTFILEISREQGLRNDKSGEKKTYATEKLRIVLQSSML